MPPPLPSIGSYFQITRSRTSAPPLPPPSPIHSVSPTSCFNITPSFPLRTLAHINITLPCQILTTLLDHRISCIALNHTPYFNITRPTLSPLNIQLRHRMSSRPAPTHYFNNITFPSHPAFSIADALLHHQFPPLPISFWSLIQQPRRMHSTQAYVLIRRQRACLFPLRRCLPCMDAHPTLTSNLLPYP